MSIAEPARLPTHKSPANLLRVSRRRPCPACGKPDWCLIASDGSAALCMREPSVRPAKSGGGWWHSFAGAHANPAPQLPRRPAVTTSRASVAHVDRVLRSFLREHLTLSPAHRESLLRRGLTAGEISRNCYASAPAPARSSDVARALSPLGLEGVPGFYLEARAWRMVNLGPGFYVPVLDERGLITGLQLRRDMGAPKYLWFSSAGRDRGASSGAPVHFARPDLVERSRELVVTEGALKADVVSGLSGEAVAGLAGVGSFGPDFAARLRGAFPALRRAVVAYDRDFLHNPQVRRALERLAGQLRRASFEVRVRTWPPPAKGYDDYLLSQLGRGGEAP